MVEPEVGVPVLLVRTGQRVWDYGALATVRTLGRFGVKVFVLATANETELLESRYLGAVIGMPLDPAAETTVQVAALNAAVARIGSTCVGIAGDDESAVLLAEQRAHLDARLLTDPVPADLPRSLSDKVALGALAAQAGVPYPASMQSADPAALRTFAEEIGYPLILKSPAPFERLQDQAVTSTSVVNSTAELQPYLRAAEAGHDIFVQQYLSGDHVQSWYAAGVSAPGEERLPVWTGRKLVAHPPQTGIGVVNVALPNPRLARHVADLCQHIGYLGPFDTDWIVDPGRGTARLIDFNPRRGAQFRTFQTTTGMDAVRAAYICLTGGLPAAGEQEFGLVHCVENLATLRGPKAWPWRYRTRHAPVELTWYAKDDLGPARSMASQMLASARRKVRARVRKG